MEQFANLIDEELEKVNQLELGIVLVAYEDDKQQQNEQKQL
ncbi:hypothetical protein [Aquibacillus kalidii]|nr:hypothetical protein [Aquibacillus kalidii]